VEAHLKSFKELVSETLEGSRKDTPFSSYTFKESRTESGQRVLWLNIVFQNKSDLDMIQEFVNTIDVRSLDANLELSQKPGACQNLDVECCLWGCVRVLPLSFS
jgi:hypothetical protein